jgi:hypothetical protein
MYGALPRDLHFNLGANLIMFPSFSPYFYLPTSDRSSIRWLLSQPEGFLDECRSWGNTVRKAAQLHGLIVEQISQLVKARTQ